MVDGDQWETIWIKKDLKFIFHKIVNFIGTLASKILIWGTFGQTRTISQQYAPRVKKANRNDFKIFLLLLKKSLTVSVDLMFMSFSPKCFFFLNLSTDFGSCFKYYTHGFLDILGFDISGFAKVSRKYIFYTYLNIISWASRSNSGVHISNKASKYVFILSNLFCQGFLNCTILVIRRAPCRVRDLKLSYWHNSTDLKFANIY